MAGQTIAGLAVSLSLQSAEFVKGINDALNKTKMLKAGLATIKMGAGMAAGAAVGLAHSVIRLTDELSDLSDSTGIQASKLLAMRNSMIAAGGGAEDMNKAITKLGVNTGKAMSGDAGAQKHFKELGVFVTDASGKLRDQNDIVDDVLKKLAAIEDPAVRAARAAELLGKSAAKIDWTKVKATPSSELEAQIKQMGELQNKFDKLTADLQQRGIEIGAGFYDGISKGLAKSVEALGDFMSQIDPTGLFAFLTKKAKDASYAAEIGGGRGRYGGPTSAELEKHNKGPLVKGGYGAMSDADKNKLADLRSQSNELSNQISFMSRRGLLEQASLRYGSEYTSLQTAHLKYEEDILKAKSEYEKQVKQEPQFAAQYLELYKQKSALAFAELQSEKEALKTKQEMYNVSLLLTGLQADEARAGAIQDKRDAYRGLMNAQGVLGTDAKAELGFMKAGDTSASGRIGFDRREGGSQFNAAYAEVINLTEGLENQSQLIADWSAKWNETTGVLQNVAKETERISEVNNTVLGSMNSAIDNFVETGKFKMKDFASSIIKEFIKIEMRAAASSLWKAVGGGSGVVSMISSAFGGFRAEGGPVSSGKSYIVGERGPELFTPSSSGGITPNHALGSGGGTTVVNYNISAVDAKSFQQLVLSNPQAIYAATMGGQKKMQAGGRV